jgi:hypothetical protein
MQTIDVRNNKSSETHYVTLTDIGNMDPCSFPKRKNPVNGAKCKETFQINMENDDIQIMTDDPIAQLYLASLAGLGIYILYRFMEKSR